MSASVESKGNVKIGKLLNPHSLVLQLIELCLDLNNLIHQALFRLRWYFADYRHVYISELLVV